MAASECAKFCVVLFTIAIALVSASKSDKRKDVIDVQDYITLRNLVKELQVTLKPKGPWISIRNVGEQATSVGEENWSAGQGEKTKLASH